MDDEQGAIDAWPVHNASRDALYCADDMLLYASADGWVQDLHQDIAEMYSELSDYEERVRWLSTPLVVDAFRAANPYPCHIGERCEASFLELVNVYVGDVLYGLLFIADQKNCNRWHDALVANRRQSKRRKAARPPRPRITAKQVLSHADEIRHYAKTTLIPGPGLGMSLWKEAFRVTGYHYPKKPGSKTSLVPDGTRRLEIERDPPRCKLDGKTYPLTDDGADLLSAMLDNRGGYVTASIYTSKPGRLRASWPDEVRAVVDCSTKGYRLTI